MLIEKVLAIEAAPSAVWEALTGELDAASPQDYRVEESSPERSLVVHVKLAGGIPARISYQLTPREEHTEVAATLEPYGFRYRLFSVMTLGRSSIGYETVLAEGLLNLQAAVEGAARRRHQPPSTDID
jgi:hypothetical protein